MTNMQIDCFGRLHDLDTTMNASVPTGHLRDHATRVNTSVWMEDVAHAVWFDRCVAQVRFTAEFYEATVAS